MKPGHPFLTDDLDETRARQRRDLAGIPAWIFERMQPTGVATPQTEHAAAQFEVRARQLADEAREEIDGDLRRSMQAHVEGEIGWELWHLVDDRVERWAFGDPEDRLISERADSRVTAYGGDAVGGALRRWVTWLVVADELSDDGYRDPRLT